MKTQKIWTSESFRSFSSIGIFLVSLVILLLSIGCRFPWQKRDTPISQGRIIKESIDFYEMARAMERHGNFDGALRNYQRSIDISPRPMAYLAMGMLLTDLHRFDQALVALQQAATLSPDDPLILAELDRTQAMRDLVSRGESVPDAATVRPPAPPMPPEERVAETREQPPTFPAPPPPLPADRAPVPEPPVQEVIEHTPPEVEIEPEETQVPPGLDDALTEAEEARLRSRIAVGRELIIEERLEEAARYINRSLIEFPRSGRLYYNLGYVYQLQGKWETALEAYERALSLNYKSGDIHNNLGILYHTLGRSEDAVESFRSSLVAGGYPEAAYRLGEVLELRGELDQALEAYDTYLRLAPQGELANEAESRAQRIRRRR